MLATVVGCGQMGVAIATYLKKLGCDLNCVDKSHERLKAIRHLGNTFSDFRLVQDSDVFVSASPYYINLNIAKHCLDFGIPYCDLGGDTDTSYAINNLA